MINITRDEINVINNINNKIDTRIRQLLQLRDSIPYVTGWFIKDNKIFVNYEDSYSNDINYKDEYKDLKHKSIYWDLDYFLSYDRQKEWELYLKVKKDREQGE